MISTKAGMNCRTFVRASTKDIMLMKIIPILENEEKYRSSIRFGMVNTTREITPKMIMKFNKIYRIR
jgi:hypothetical protein